jgi:hypothetical protein
VEQEQEQEEEQEQEQEEEEGAAASRQQLRLPTAAEQQQWPCGSDYKQQHVSHLISSHLISSHLISSHLISWPACPRNSKTLRAARV